MSLKETRRSWECECCEDGSFLGTNTVLYPLKKSRDLQVFFKDIWDPHRTAQSLIAIQESFPPVKEIWFPLIYHLEGIGLNAYRDNSNQSLLQHIMSEMRRLFRLFVCPPLCPQDHKTVPSPFNHPGICYLLVFFRYQRNESFHFHLSLKDGDISVSV